MPKRPSRLSIKESNRSVIGIVLILLYLTQGTSSTYREQELCHLKQNEGRKRSDELSRKLLDQGEGKNPTNCFRSTGVFVFF